MNEFYTNGADYYLAYQELFFDSPEHLKDKDYQVIFNSYNDLYESMA